jgi:hypothetical protein
MAQAQAQARRERLPFRRLNAQARRADERCAVANARRGEGTMRSGTATGPEQAPGQPPRRVLEDESGQRLRRLRFVGRAVALLALCWLALIVLGGLGVGPAKHLPFGSELRLSVAPPPLRALPTPRQPPASDLVPALPAPPSRAAAPPTTAAGVPSPARASGRAATATPGTATTPGRSAAAPGRTPATTSSRGKATAPGQATTERAVPAGAAAAPGRAKHATTTGSTKTTPKTPPSQRKKP